MATVCHFLFLSSIGLNIGAIPISNRSSVAGAVHCEVLGSSLQQLHQHQVFRAHFEAEPYIQAEANNEQRIFRLVSRSKIIDKVITDKISLPCSAR